MADDGVRAALARLRGRVAALPPAVRARLGVGGDAAPLAVGCWGFTRTPHLTDLLSSEARHASLPPPEPPGPLTDTTSRSPFVAALLDSSSFHAAEAAGAMAGAAGITPSDLLTLSAIQPPPPDAAERRSAFKAAVRAAWAVAETEAGIAAARAGDASGAAARYEAALALDPACADALVARGAAAANARRFGAAIADFKAALTAQPGHANAAGYLAAVRAKADALGVGSLVTGGLARPPRGLGEEVGRAPPQAPAPAPPAVAAPPAEPAAKRRRSCEASPARRKSSSKKRKKGSKDKKSAKKHRKDKRHRRRRSSSSSSYSGTSSSSE